ncbi:MAG: eukaryotic-like serine/threonine-protein kinase [Thermodesulfobacteriota bacterium]|nr:eukaryotic-like serine/threonine-protein kinase [Thermodesulfobacteriota bacterium]
MGDRIEDTIPDNSVPVQDLKSIDTVGRYKITKQLGKGGSGVVYLGVDPYIKRNVAIKMSKLASDRERAHFFVEAQSAGRLNHPNIVSIYDAGLHEEYCYIAMEYIEGPTLEKFCSKESLLPFNTVIEIVINICSALDYAHKQKVIHRDIKPTNIMLDSSLSPKIADFSIAQISETTVEMGIFGTPSYMSPEQLKDSQVSGISDIFSLGCVLYEMLAGVKAFPGDNHFSIMYKINNENPLSLQSVRQEIPGILDEITQKALAKNPAERYQTCMDLAYDLRVALRGFTETAVNGKVKDVIDFMLNLPFFKNFSKEHIKELIATSKITKVRKGKTIVTEGEIDDTFYIILSGKVRINKGDKTISVIGHGECFGEMAYISGQARAATVIAETDCILLIINAPLLDRSSESIQLLFFKNFAITLVNRLSQTP